METLKKTYRWVAGLALAHVLALGGGVAFLMSGGHLDAERARAIVAVLRGEAEMLKSDATDAGTMKQGESASGGASTDRGDRQVAEELAWRNLDRYRTQLEQRLKLINAARIDLERERESFEAMRAQERAERERRAKEASQPGYQKELEILEALVPGAALDQIMTMNDADAAHVMFQLDTRKVKKIFETARTDAEKRKLTTIRELMRDLKPAEAMAGTTG